MDTEIRDHTSCVAYSVRSGWRRAACSHVCTIRFTLWLCASLDLAAGPHSFPLTLLAPLLLCHRFGAPYGASTLRSLAARLRPAWRCNAITVGSRAMAAWTSLTLIVPMPLGTRARGHFLSFPLYNLRNADRTREIGNREVHPARAGRLLFIRVSDDEGRPPRSRQPAWGRVLLALEWHRRANDAMRCRTRRGCARMASVGRACGSGGRHAREEPRWRSEKDRHATS